MLFQSDLGRFLSIIIYCVSVLSLHTESTNSMICQAKVKKATPPEGTVMTNLFKNRLVEFFLGVRATR